MIKNIISVYFDICIIGNSLPFIVYIAYNTCLALVINKYFVVYRKALMAVSPTCA